MGEDLARVRTEVRRLLETTPAYTELSEDAQRSLAQGMVKVGKYLSQDPSFLDSTTSAVRAEALAGDDAVGQLKERLAADPGLVGSDFVAGGVREGIEGFRRLVDTVDFPDFVSGLIQGVFRSIVDASIQQMEAYAEMLAAVSKSVDQFAQDEISEGQARDYLRNRYPKQLRVDTTGDTATLKAQEGVDDTSNIGAGFGVDGLDLDDPESELALVNAAKLEMARSRQQLLATMVLLGLNRILVTNGRINAKVVFDIQASDEASRRAQASLHDEQKSSSIAGATYVAPWGGGGGGRTSSHKTTVKSSVVDESDANVQAKAQLTGEVRVNFRSDAVPLERMVDNLDLQVLQNKAQPPSRMRGPGSEAATGAPT